LSNRIDDNKPTTLPETTITGSPDADETEVTSAADKASVSADAPGQRDEIGTYSSNPWDDFVGDDADARPANFMDEAPAGTSNSIKAGLAASGGGIDFDPSPRQKLQGNDVVNDVVDVLRDESVDADDLISDDGWLFVTEGKVEDRVLSGLGVSGKGELAAAFENPGELQAYLADEIGKRPDVEPGSAEANELASKAVEEMKQSAASAVAEATQTRVVGAIDDAEAFLETLEQPQTKRTIAYFVADAGTPKQDKIASVREQFGLSQEAAEDLIDGMHGESPENAAEHLQDWIDVRKSGLDDVRDRAKSGQITDALMTSELFSAAREDALDASVEEYGPGIEHAFEEVRAQAEHNAELEDDMITRIQIVTALGVTAMTGGAAGPWIAGAASAAQSAPGVAEAQANVGAGHASDLAHVSDGNRGEQAEFERNVEVGKAVASVAFGAATGGAKANNPGQIEAAPEFADFVKTGVFSGGAEAADWAISDLFD
jgi:hypothetical protein